MKVKKTTAKESLRSKQTETQRERERDNIHFFP